MIKPEEAEEREESRSLNEYWMEDTEVVSTCVMAMAMIIFGEKEALNHCFLHNVYNRNSCRCRHQVSNGGQLDQGNPTKGDSYKQLSCR